MATELTPQQQSVVSVLAANGQYAGDQQVLDEALELLRQRDTLRGLLRTGVEQLDNGERHAASDVFVKIRQSRTGE